MPNYIVTPECTFKSDIDPPVSKEAEERALLQQLADKYGFLLIADHRKACKICVEEDK